MGEKLLKYFKYIHDEKGLMGSVDLAKATKIPSINAATTADSPENIRLFRDAVKAITGKDAPFY